jgi:hypothetical protein
MKNEDIQAGMMPVESLSPFKRLSFRMAREADIPGGESVKVVLQQPHPYLKCALLVCKPADLKTVRELTGRFEQAAADKTISGDRKTVGDNVYLLLDVVKRMTDAGTDCTVRAGLPKLARLDGVNTPWFHSGEAHCD